MRYVWWYLIMAFGTAVNAQQSMDYPDNYFRAPLDIDLYLSGTFGELRSGHFHSGIDIKTQGREGLPVLAAADGYVSRIKVSPYGYGKALYVAHPNGYTSVYGHLKNYDDDIEAYVRDHQYRRESFAIQLFPEEDLLSVRKGDTIAWSGNTGSSGGPHLHFEIRDAAQHPINPLLFGIQIKDYVRPRMTRLALYPLDSLSHINKSNKPLYISLQGWGLEHRLPDNTELRAYGKIGLGISVYDQHNDIPNKNGSYAIDFKVNDSSIRSFTANSFGFHETRYLNSIIDYGFYLNNHNRIIRSEKDPNNQLSMYDELQPGFLLINDSSTQNIRIEAKDFHGNLAVLAFDIASDVPIQTNHPMAPPGIFVQAGIADTLISEQFEVIFGEKALYRNQWITYDWNDSIGDQEFPVWNFHNPEVPLHQYIDIKVFSLEVTDKLADHLLMVRNYKDRIYAAGGRFQEGIFTAQIRDFGTYTWTYDTINPEIRLLNFSDGQDISGLDRLKVRIEDELSGIESYRASLNGKWILMEYDPKNNLLVYDFDERMKPGTNQFELCVQDKASNTHCRQAVIHY